ncbi:MAG: hypothetical protein LQ344_006939 [Seirophora lacunosa]|nr:MAG: hypothetical protein LQ344_006939 [Seirophora lacunosa]
MDKKAGIGELLCKVCGQQFQTGINLFTSLAADLSAGVDVYSDWIDACDSVAKEAGNTGRDAEDSSHYQSHSTVDDSEKHVDMPTRQRLSAVGGGEDDVTGAYGDDVT